MSRRKRSVRREVAADPIYNDLNIAKFINKVMNEGKKCAAESIVYNSLDEAGKKVKKLPLEVFYQVIKNVMPVMVLL